MRAFVPLLRCVVLEPCTQVYADYKAFCDSKGRPLPDGLGVQMREHTLLVGVRSTRFLPHNGAPANRMFGPRKLRCVEFFLQAHWNAM